MKINNWDAMLKAFDVIYEDIITVEVAYESATEDIYDFNLPCSSACDPNSPMYT